MGRDWARINGTLKILKALNCNPHSECSEWDLLWWHKLDNVPFFFPALYNTVIQWRSGISYNSWIPGIWSNCTNFIVTAFLWSWGSSWQLGLKLRIGMYGNYWGLFQTTLVLEQKNISIGCVTRLSLGPTFFSRFSAWLCALTGGISIGSKINVYNSALNFINIFCNNKAICDFLELLPFHIHNCRNML